MKHYKHSYSFDMQKEAAHSFRSVYYFFFAGIILLVAAFLFIAPAQAQTEEGSPDTPAEAAPSADVSVSAEAVADPAVTEEVVEAAEEATVQSEALADAAPVVAEVPSEVSAEVAEDSSVTAEDLGAKEAVILPDSPLHIFKRFGRGVQEAFTFDPVKKAEIKLEHANQEIFEAKILAEKKGLEDKGAANAAIKAVERAQEKLADIADVAEDLKAGKKEDAGEVDHLLDMIADHQFKQERVFDILEEKIEDVANAGDVIHFKEQRGLALEHTGKVLSDVEDNAEAVTQRFTKVLGNQQGSDFKELKNLEILKRLEDRVPEQAKDAIRNAQKASAQRFQETTAQLSEEDRGKRMVHYTKGIRCDEKRFLQITDELKQFGLPDDMMKKVEEMKDIMANRVGDKLAKYEDRPELRDFYFKDITEGDNFDNVRVMEEISSRVVIANEEIQQEIKKHRDEGAKAFKEKFTDPTSQNQVQKFQELSKKMAERPDPTTMKLLMELEAEVTADPSKAEFVAQMKQLGSTTRGAFEQRVKLGFGNQMISNNPNDLAIMQQFSENFQGPPADFDFEAEFGADFFAPKGFPSFPPFGGTEGEAGGSPGQPGAGFPFGPPGGFTPPSFGDDFDAFAFFKEKQTESIQDYVKNVDPTSFQIFQNKFQNADQNIVNQFQQFGDFKNAFNQKSQETQQFFVQQEQNQLFQQLQQQGGGAEGGLNEAAFQKQLQQNLQEKGFGGPGGFNPFCDAACQAGQQQNFQKQLEQSGAQFQKFQTFVQQQQQGGQQGQQGQPSFPGQPPFGQPGFSGESGEGHDGPQGVPFGPEGFTPPGQPQGQPFSPEGFIPPGLGDKQGLTPPGQPFGGQGEAGQPSLPGQQQKSGQGGQPGPSFKPFQKPPFFNPQQKSGQQGQGGEGQTGSQQPKPSFDLVPKPPVFSQPGDTSGSSKPFEPFGGEGSFKPPVFDTKTGEAIKFPPGTEPTPKPVDVTTPQQPTQPSSQPTTQPTTKVDIILPGQQPTTVLPTQPTGPIQPTTEPITQPTTQPVTQPTTQPTQPTTLDSSHPAPTTHTDAPAPSPTPSPTPAPTLTPTPEPTPAPAPAPAPAPSSPPPSSPPPSGPAPAGITGIIGSFFGDMFQSVTIVSNFFAKNAKAASQLFLQ